MKKINIISWMLLLFVTACSTDNESDTIIEDPAFRSSNVTFSSEMDGVSVLIFGKNDDDQFYYKRSISSGWSADKKVSALVDRGYYKFLFMKSAGTTTSFDPALQRDVTGVEDFRIKAQADPVNGGYLLPVDEIWLSKSSKANIEHEVLEPTYVKDSIYRVVSKIMLNVKRGYHNGEDYVELPFPNGVNIMRDIQEIELDISGVGEAINLDRSFGNSKTLFTTSAYKEITDEGFAVFEGPFVFPPENLPQSTVEITITPKAGSPFPVMTKQITGPIEKNHQLIITLWVTDTYQFINITVENAPLSKVEDGDEGVWE